MTKFETILRSFQTSTKKRVGKMPTKLSNLDFTKRVETKCDAPPHYHKQYLFTGITKARNTGIN